MHTSRFHPGHSSGSIRRPMREICTKAQLHKMKNEYIRLFFSNFYGPRICNLNYLILFTFLWVHGLVLVDMEGRRLPPFRTSRGEEGKWKNWTFYLFTVKYATQTCPSQAKLVEFSRTCSYKQVQIRRWEWDGDYYRLESNNWMGM